MNGAVKAALIEDVERRALAMAMGEGARHDNPVVETMAHLHVAALMLVAAGMSNEEALRAFVDRMAVARAVAAARGAR